MSSLSPRNPLEDQLLAPDNSALLVIDYQPPQIYSASSADPDTLVPNVVALAKVAKLFELPTLTATVGVANGTNPDTIPQLREQLAGVLSYDRTAINAWEDADFVQAVRGLNRNKLITVAPWTEMCLVFTALDALREGFEVYPVVDCVAGTSREAHEAGIQRIVQAGAHPVSWISVLCELQRDWNRNQTAQGMLQIALERGDPFGVEVALKIDQTSLASPSVRNHDEYLRHQHEGGSWPSIDLCRACRQNRSSVLAPSLLAVGSMQKY